MNNKKHFFKTNLANKTGFVLGAVLLTALTGWAGYAAAQGVGITVTVPVAPVVVVPDDYVYYPGYGVYYNSHRHEYAYLDRDSGVWVARSAPPGVSSEVLLASPSVNMDFHDSPARHHAEMMQKYPKNWRPAEVHQDRKEDQKPGVPDGDKKLPGQMPPH
jgi:hypothetical protein